MFNLWNTLLAVVNQLVQVLLSLFPASDPQVLAEITLYKTQFIGTVSSLNWFFPVDTLFQFLALVLGIELLMLNTKVAHWVLKIITFGIIK